MFNQSSLWFMYVHTYPALPCLHPSPLFLNSMQIHHHLMSDQHGVRDLHPLPGQLLHPTPVHEPHGRTHSICRQAFLRSKAKTHCKDLHSQIVFLSVIATYLCTTCSPIYVLCVYIHTYLHMYIHTRDMYVYM